MMMKKAVLCFLVPTLAWVAGCGVDASSQDDDVNAAPVADHDMLEEAQLLTNGAWTAFAYAPVYEHTNLSFSLATQFTGPSGATRRMGSCLLRMTTTACSTVANCGSVPVPAGGFRYCTAPNNSGQSVCAVRPGSPSNFCIGTPALGGAQIAPGFYEKYNIPAAQYGRYVNYACFEGCTASDPGVSSVQTTAQPPQYCGGVRCD